MRIDLFFDTPFEDNTVVVGFMLKLRQMLSLMVVSFRRCLKSERTRTIVSFKLNVMVVMVVLQGYAAKCGMLVKG